MVNAKTIMRTKFLPTVMLLRVLNNEGNVMTHHFFPQGLKINAADYKEVSEMVVRPWIESVIKGRTYTY